MIRQLPDAFGRLFRGGPALTDDEIEAIVSDCEDTLQRGSHEEFVQVAVVAMLALEVKAARETLR